MFNQVSQKRFKLILYFFLASLHMWYFNRLIHNVLKWSDIKDIKGLKDCPHDLTVFKIQFKVLHAQTCTHKK